MLPFLPHLKGLRLAHPVSERSLFDIDILIGADFYWNIVGNQVIQGQGPSAVNSRIGFLVSGRLNGVPELTRQPTLSFHVSVQEKFDVTRFW